MIKNNYRYYIILYRKKFGSKILWWINTEDTIGGEKIGVNLADKVIMQKKNQSKEKKNQSPIAKSVKDFIVKVFYCAYDDSLSACVHAK